MINFIMNTVFILAGILMVITGVSLLIDWYMRMKKWETAPSISEALDCLFDGLAGGLGASLGNAILVVTLYAALYFLM